MLTSTDAPRCGRCGSMVLPDDGRCINGHVITPAEVASLFFADPGWKTKASNWSRLRDIIEARDQEIARRVMPGKETT